MTTQKHSFSIQVAKEYGINAAVILDGLHWWITHNRANGTNYHDGNYWTYNSVKAYQKEYPYLTEKQIYKALKDLETAGLIKTANYNQMPYDRTKWYALTEKGYSMYSETILHDGITDFTYRENGNDPQVEPIPVINQLDEPNKKEKVKKENFDDILSSIESDQLRDAFLAFIEMRKTIRKPLTPHALKLLINKLQKMTKDVNKQIAIVEQSVMNSWQGLFELKQNNNSGNLKADEPSPYQGASSDFSYAFSKERRKEWGFDD